MGTEHNPSASPQWRPYSASSSPACTFLAPRLLATASDFLPSLGRCCTTSFPSHLHSHDIVQYGFIDFRPEYSVTQIDFRDPLILNIIYTGNWHFICSRSC